MPPQTHLPLLTDPKVSQLQLPLWVTAFAWPTHTLTQPLNASRLNGRGADAPTHKHTLTSTRHVHKRKTYTNLSAGTNAQLTVWLQGSASLRIDQERPPSFVLVCLLLSCYLCAFSQEVLLSWCEAQRPLAVSERARKLTVWEGGEKRNMQARTIFVDTRLSSTERAVEKRLKWISSEKANRRTQIQGCFWLLLPLLFWSGRRSSNSRGCPFSCEAVVCFCAWVAIMRRMLWLKGI